jgi:hypothetical protein
VFSVLLVTGMVAAGFPIRDRHAEEPLFPPPCQRGLRRVRRGEVLPIQAAREGMPRR